MIIYAQSTTGERERNRDRDRQADRQRHTDRDRQTDRDRRTETDRETDRQTETERPCKSSITDCVAHPSATQLPHPYGKPSRANGCGYTHAHTPRPQLTGTAAAAISSRSLRPHRPRHFCASVFTSAALIGQFDVLEGP